MTSRFSLHAFGTLTLAGGLLLATGCSTPGYRQAAATSGSITTAAEDIDAAQRYVSAALISLDQLLNRPNTDLRSAFADYRNNVDSLDRSMERLHDRAQEMADRRVEYVRTWDRQNEAIVDEAIRARSIARQKEVESELLQAERSYLNARESLDPLLANLRDVERLLSVDLTPAGAQNARNAFGQTERSAENAREALSRLAQDFREISLNLDPTAPVIAE